MDPSSWGNFSTSTAQHSTPLPGGQWVCTGPKHIVQEERQRQCLHTHAHTHTLTHHIQGWQKTTPWPWTSLCCMCEGHLENRPMGNADPCRNSMVYIATHHWYMHTDWRQFSQKSKYLAVVSYDITPFLSLSRHSQVTSISLHCPTMSPTGQHVISKHPGQSEVAMATESSMWPTTHAGSSWFYHHQTSNTWNIELKFSTTKNCILSCIKPWHTGITGLAHPDITVQYVSVCVGGGGQLSNGSIAQCDYSVTHSSISKLIIS